MAPQNTFLDTIIRKFDSQSKCRRVFLWHAPNFFIRMVEVSRVGAPPRYAIIQLTFIFKSNLSVCAVAAFFHFGAGLVTHQNRYGASFLKGDVT